MSVREGGRWWVGWVGMARMRARPVQLVMVTGAARDVLLGKAQPFWVPELMDRALLIHVRELRHAAQTAQAWSWRAR